MALHMLKDGLMSAAWAVLPLALTMMAVGIAAAGAQGGIRVATKLFIPKFSRLNPCPGSRRCSARRRSGRAPRRWSRPRAGRRAVHAR
jgi:flagellar biosynthesis protein FlhB